MLSLNVNNKVYEISTDPDQLLVWVIHSQLGLTKTRFGCGMAMCGACKTLVDEKVVQTCLVKVKDVVGKKITTRELLPENVFLSSSGET